MAKSHRECTVETREECSHVDNRFVTVSLNSVQEKFEWVKHADEQFPGHRSEPPHLGNLSKMVRHYVRTSIRELEEGGSRDFSPSDLSSQDEMVEEIQVLRARNQTLQSELEDAEQELEKTKRKLRKTREDVVQYMARPKTDQLMLEIGLVVTKALEEPRTVAELAEILRQHGVDEYLEEISGIDNPPKQYEGLLLRNIEDLEELADRFLDELQDKGFVEVREEYGRFVYRTTR